MEQIRVHPVATARAEAAARPKTSRLYFIDHLRAALVILVVLHHVALVYGASAPFYYVEPPFDDPDAFRGFLIFVLFNQAWFMGAFFLLAGYFTPDSYDRKGAAEFLKERLIRLGIPVLVFLFILSPISELGVYLMPEALTGITDSPTWDDYPDMIGLGPLWFVAMLLTFSVGYTLWRVLTKNQTWARIPESASPGYVLVAAFAALLAAVTFGFRTIVPIGESVEVFWDALSFPTIAYLPQYLSLFVVGLMASRIDWFRNLPNQMGLVGLVVAIIAAVVLFPLAFSGEFFSVEITPALDNAMGDGHWQSGVYAIWDSLMAVGLGLGLVVLFRTVWNSKGALGIFLAQQSYAVYIIHIPIIVFLAYLLRDVDMDALPKFALASLITVPLCFVVAYLLRKIPYATRVL